MKIDKIDVNETLENARKLLEEDKNSSPALKSMFKILLLIITLLVNRLGLNSKNSSKPPSHDPNRVKKARGTPADKKPGGQLGHIGKTLTPVDNPDEVKNIAVDKKTLPLGEEYKDAGYIARQVINIRISRYVIEYRAQVLQNSKGDEYIALFPEHVTRSVQYQGNRMKFILKTYR